jgi:hypothetical protein
VFNVWRVARLAGGLAVVAVALAGPATASESGYIERLERPGSPTCRVGTLCVGDTPRATI